MSTMPEVTRYRYCVNCYTQVPADQYTHAHAHKVNLPVDWANYPNTAESPFSLGVQWTYEFYPTITEQDAKESFEALKDFFNR